MNEKLIKKEVQELLPLTPMQAGILFTYLRDPGTGCYFEQLILEISGDIEVGHFKTAWNFVIETNEMLRTVFRWEKVGNPVQIILKEHKFHLVYHDLSARKPAETKILTEELKNKDRTVTFDLREVPFRVTLCKVESTRYEMIISYHHILYDGWSNGIILKEFFEAYRNLSKRKELEKPIKTKFKEFVQWIQKQDIDKQKRFWQHYLAGFDTQSEFSIKQKRKEKSCKSQGDREKVCFSESPLRDLCKRCKITLASLLCTAWGVLLQKYNNTADVIFGTTVSGRTVKVPGIENLVGLLINTIPLRVRTFADEPVLNLLHRIDNALHLREPYESTSLVKLKEYSELNPKEELFDTLVIIENYPLDLRLKPGSSEFAPLCLDSFSINEMTDYDLTLSIMVPGIEITFTYNGSVFAKQMIMGVSRHFLRILEEIAANPAKKPGEIDLLSAEEKQKILYGFNETRAGYPTGKTLQQSFAEQAARIPGHTALSGQNQDPASQIPNQEESPGERHLTYKELSQQANRWSHLLREKGVLPGTMVAIMVERSMEMVVAIWGILSAGAAYLPIDPNFPEERSRYMLKDSGAYILLTAREIAEFSSPQALNHRPRGAAVHLHLSLAPATSPAYIIYTSGSTGKPKGVIVEHPPVLNLLFALEEKYPVTQNDLFLLKTPLVFDVSVTELFGWFLGGGRLGILEKHAEKDPGKILETIKSLGITHINIVPAMFKVFLDELNAGNTGKLSSLKYIFLAGETIFPGLVERFGRLNTGIALENLYGPTEAAVYATAYSLSRWNGQDSIPIGKPLPYVTLYIRDSLGHVQPIGIPGELSIGGMGVARGYLNNPELTAERFCLRRPGALFKKTAPGPRKNFLVNQSPITNHQSPIYQTGDLARWWVDGNIEFLGRIDHQVKIRGFRIELGEIENRLLNHKEIKDAVVIVKENVKKEKYLCAFIVSEKKFNTGELRAYLAGELPGYMIPAHFSQLSELPLTPGGKVDRPALPDSAAALESGVEYISPGSDIEKTIAGIWQELLGLDKVSIHENFFDIGGNSFSLIRLNSRLKKALKKDIPMMALFNYPTVASLALHLSGGKRKQEEHSSKIDLEPVERSSRREIEIAVIGMSARFPGAKHIDEFWNNLKNGIESITFLTGEESLRLEPGTEFTDNSHYVPAKGILEDKNHFDALFFGYTPVEAEIMDPQVRIFHECCWEALEHAGYDPETYQGLIGLYAGASPNPYWEILPLKSCPDGPSYAEQWDAVQFSDKDYLSTRIAYKLDLKGPGVTMQTACSTSLAAVDLACRGLLSGSGDMALAGGVSITYHDEIGYLYQEGTIMSPDGHCRAFDARANGTVGGNGAGVVLLKPLAQAVNDKDTIYSVIKGFGINNDGKNKPGFTAPSAAGQARAIRAAQRMAGIEPDSIGYIETHGTATLLGDPIEIEALKHAFAAGTTNPGKKNYCALGSVKTNIGHLDAAAGIAGLIKTVLILKHRVIPPTLHFFQPNPAIDFENSPFYVNTHLKPWQNDEYPLRAGVSSFGLGGTNAHVVLEECPDGLSSNAGRRAQSAERREHGSWGQGRGNQSREYQLILLSAKTGTALEKMTSNLAEYFKKNPNVNIADTAYTLQMGRKSFSYRKMLVSGDLEEVVRKLAANEAAANTAKEKKSTVIFMFSGQGSQYVNMGLDLYNTEPLFHNQLDDCFARLENIAGIDMKSVLYPNKNNTGAAEEKINQFLYATPIKFIFEYTLAVLLMNWGIEPDAMIGHSFGEYVAACLSGVFSLEDALFLAALRGELMHGLPEGAMLSVPLAETELKPLLDEKISLAAVNAPSMCVVSGPVEAVDAFEKKLNQKGHEGLRYHVPKAGHSRMVEPILEEFKEKIKRVKFNKPQIPYISGLTGKWITPGQAVDPGYWTWHLRETVRFADGLTTLFKEENPVFLQVGPGRGLTLFVNRHPDKKTNTLALNLVRHPKEAVSDVYYTLQKIGQLWLHGVPIDGRGFYSNQMRYRIPLPTYPFEGKPYYPPENLLKIGVDRSSPKPLLTHKTDISDWFYIPVWEQSPLISLPTNKSRETQESFNWLVFMDDLGLGTRLVKALRKTADQVVTVKVGEKYAEEGENSYLLNPGQAKDYHRLFHELRESGLLPQKIIHLWSVTDNQKLAGGLKELDRVQELGFYSLFYMFQAVGPGKVSREIQVKVVTNNMQSVTGEEDTCPGKATLRGALKIIPLEYDNINCAGIDILLPRPGRQIPGKLVRQLLEELMVDTDSPGNISALRGNRRWCETMRPCRLEKADQPVERLKKQGVYLITGGLGGMGFTFARYLANDFRAKLILVGRSFFPARKDWAQWMANHPKDDKISVKIRKIQEWEEWGAEIMVCSADVSNEKQVRAVISRAHQRFGPINGVLHTAGVGDYAGVIRERTREMTEQVMAAKVKGTLVLDRILKDDRLDFLVLFSSIGNIIYQVKFGQVGYNAANEFLEAFAYYKTRKDGTYTVTINWNDWLEVGMSIEAANRKYRKHWKYKTPGDFSELDYESAIHAGITPAQGVEVFTRILGRPLERVTVSMVDLNGMVQVLRDLKNKDSSTFEAVEQQAASMVVEQRPPLSTAYIAPADPLQEALAKIWCNYFGIQSIGTEDDFFELGGDSLKAMIITHKIQKELDVPIPLADFFNNPTIKGQAEYIHLTGSPPRRADKKIYSSYSPITPAEEKEYYALSSAQQRIYVLHQVEAKNISYNITHTMILEGEIDKRRLEGTFYRLIERHESLRTSFHMVGDHPLQKVHDETVIGHWSLVIGEADRSEIDGIIKDFVKPFDLSRAPLLRAGLTRIDEREYLLVVDMHHIISDGTSVDILKKEFAALYRNKALPGLRLRYKDYSEWQLQRKQKKPGLETVKKQEAYWLKQFQGELPVLDLPLDYSRPAVQGFEGNSQGFEIGAAETKRLKELALERETTLFTLLLALCNTWLARLTGQEEIILGSVTAGRKDEDLQAVLGMFVNTLTSRNFPIGEKTFTQFLGEVKERTLAAFENQDYPFEDLVEKVILERDTSRNPLFDVMFILQNTGITHLQIPGLTVKPYRFETGISKFDLTLEGVEQENKLQFTVEYNTKLFNPGTIERFIGYFKKLVSSVPGYPEVKLSEIEIISEDEKKQVLLDFSNINGETGFPPEKTIHRLFDEQVELRPDQIAVVGPLAVKYRTYMTDMTDISYRKLNERSNQLALLLKEKGVEPDTIVGIMMERSVEMIIGILGILKAGGAYLPIETDYPEERINYMLNDAKVKFLVIKSNNFSPSLTNEGLDTIFLDDLLNKTCPKGAPSRPSTLPPFYPSQSSPAYIIYTSGTSGKPKGILTTHTNVIRVVKNTNYIRLEETDRLLQLSNYAFDGSVFDIYGALLNSAALVMIQPEDISAVDRLARVIKKQAITVFFLTSALFNTLVDMEIGCFDFTRKVLVGGDRLSVEHSGKAREYLGKNRIINGYGPTETTVFATYYSIDRIDGAAVTIPIGKPISNTTVYILDKNFQPVPIGIVGELYIGGVGVARGYLNNPELTTEKFIDKALSSWLLALRKTEGTKRALRERNQPETFTEIIRIKEKSTSKNHTLAKGVLLPEGHLLLRAKSQEPGAILYKTGDLCRWLPDGNIEFLGRMDQQVKIRGFRIELDEIENALNSHESITDCVVVAKHIKEFKEEINEKQLCAYIVSDNVLPVSALKEYLRAIIPGYMVPSYFLHLPAIPLTPNGKIDKKALPVPGLGTDEEYTAPRNEIEEKLTRIWAEVLKVEPGKIGISSSFFDLGGDSIKIMRINAKINKIFNREISLGNFIKACTIDRLAEYISKNELSGGLKYPSAVPDPSNIYRPFPLTEVQMAYLLGRSDRIEMGGGSTHAYREYRGQLDIERFNLSLNRVIARHPMMRAIITGDGYQRILEEVKEYRVLVEDITRMSPGEQEKRLARERQRMSHYIFKTDQWPLFEIKAFKLSQHTFHFCIGFDPLIADASSMMTIARELGQYYENPQLELPALELTFRDYMMAYQELKKSAIAARDREYWLAQLEDFPPAPGLPFTCKPSKIKEPHFKVRQKVYDRSSWKALQEIAGRNNITPSALLCTAYVEVLSHWSNQQRLAVNLTVFNRFPFHKDVEHIVGDFTSLVLLGIQLKPGSTFWERARVVRDRLFAGLEHRHYDGVEFIRELARHRNAVNKAIMPIVFTSALFDESNHPDGPDREEPRQTILNVVDELGFENVTQTSQVYIDNAVSEINGRLIVNWSYVEDIFDSRLIDAMFHQYTATLTHLAQGGFKEFHGFALPGAEKRLMEVYNKTAAAMTWTPLHRLFTRQVRLNPDHTALIFGNRYLTYKELDNRANQVADYLRRQGVGRYDPVGVSTPRCQETIINVMGVLKSGGAYIPIESAYPEERRNYILAGSHCKLFLEPGTNTHENLAPYPGDININEGENRDEHLLEDLAYVIYTSGSTGKPKGVMITHRQAVNTVMDINGKFRVSSRDRLIGISSLGFDLSVYDVFGALSTGAALVSIPNQRDIDNIIEVMEKYAVTIWNSVPAVMDLVVNTMAESSFGITPLRLVLLSGDWIPINLPGKISRNFPGAKVISLGGATEGSIWSVYYPVNEVKNNWNSIPYGYPLANQRMYVLNYQLQRCPVGVPGEIYIGGTGVAEGYLNDQEKTTDSFLFHTQWGRIYRTGDHGVFHRDGYIEFLGRKDQQVKIGGFRIELGEIQGQLLKHPEVKEALVMASKNEAGDKSLCAYLVLKQGTSPDSRPGQFKEYLSRTLPVYMIPSYFVRLEHIPLTPNGKIDGNALPAPGIPVIGNITLPGNEIEKRMADIWSEVLGIEKHRINTDANFFDLGGHSLKVSLLASKIHKELAVKVPLVEVFERNTIRQLSAYVKNKTKVKYTNLEPLEKKEYYALSSAQKRTYFLQQMYAHSTAYNISAVFPLDKDMDKHKLEKALKKLVTRHESLRTSFELVNNEPVQKIHEADTVDLSMDYYETDETGAKKIIKNHIRPFDLRQTPLIRFAVAKLPPDQAICMLDIHHIVSDGTSQIILFDDFRALYNEEELEPLRYQYKDFSQWQNHSFASGGIKVQEDYWMNLLADAEVIPRVQLPLDFKRPNVFTFAGDVYRVMLEREAVLRLKRLGHHHNGTLYMSLLATLNTLFYKYTGQEDIIIGTGIAGRPNADIQQIVGMFVNTLAIRNQPTGEKTYDYFLKEVITHTIDALENQDFQFEELVDKLDLARDLSRNPLFDVCMLVQNFSKPEQRSPTKDNLRQRQTGVLPALAKNLSSIEYRNPTSKFDMTFFVYEQAEDYYLSVEYYTAIFKPATIKRLISHLRNILRTVIKEPFIKLKDIEIIDEEEKRRIIFQWNDTARDYPRDKSIHRLFAEQVNNIPDHIAVIGQSVGAIHESPLHELPLQITANELNEKSNQMARLLIEKGVKPDTLVAVMVERSIEMIIGIFGVMKAGGGYLPIDPDYPEERVDYMLADSNASILLTGKDLAPSPSTLTSTSTCQVNPTNLAYVIYTSGSTGKPKGVMIEHRNVTNLVFGLKENVYKNFNRNINIALIAPFIFDASVKQIFAALLLGHRLFLVPTDITRDGIRLMKYYRQHKIDISDGTPAHLRLLLEIKKEKKLESNISVKCFLIGGESLNHELLDKFFLHVVPDTVKVVNVYGPTECCVDSTLYEITKKNMALHSDKIPIGFPMPNQQVYILNQHHALQPRGIAGEICISGGNVGRGYLNRPQLTVKKFVDNPFLKGKKLYQTGDLARWIEDGSIEFLGRIDHQVKIRGYRIELGEIENRVSTHPAVKEAAVILRQHPSGDKYLCAYIVSNPEGAEINPGEVKEYLSETLPDYMIPSFFMGLERIPLTPNGKLNRKLLPAPGLGKTQVNYTAPGNVLEEQLAALWASVLEIEPGKIGIDDNFFELGGHSLKATVLAVSIQKELNVKVPLAEIFLKTTIRGLAKYIKEIPGTQYAFMQPVEQKEYYGLSSAQKRLFIQHHTQTDNVSYNTPLAVILEGNLEKEKLENTLKRLIQRHENLRTSFEMTGQQPIQKIHQDVDFVVRYHEGKEPEPGEFTTDFVKPFDLGNVPLLRVRLVKLLNSPTALRGHPSQKEKKGRYLLMMDMHHIITDGTSRSIMVKELMALYQGLELPLLRIQYKDFSEWQNSKREIKIVKKQEKYWLKEFAGTVTTLNLPTDYARSNTLDYEGSSAAFELDKKETTLLNHLAINEKATLYMVLMAIFNVMLSKLCDQEDILIGVPIAGRKHPDLQPLIGFFVNMLALRNCPKTGKTFRQFLLEVKEKTLNAYDNQDYPFEDLVHNLMTDRDPNRHSLIDTVFVFQNTEILAGEIPGVEIPGLKLIPYDHQVSFSPFDLILHGYETGEKLAFLFQYKTALFKDKTIQRFIKNFKEVVFSILDNKTIQLKDIKISHDLLSVDSDTSQDDQGDFEF